MSIMSAGDFRRSLDDLDWSLDDEPWKTPDQMRANNVRGIHMGAAARIWRGEGPVFEFPEKMMELGNLRAQVQGQDLTLEEIWNKTETDSVVVLHKGRLVYERYFNGMHPRDLHALASVSKSATGLVAEILIAEGVIDRQGAATFYVPELAQSAFKDATVEQLLDMSVGIAYGGRPYHRYREAHRMTTMVGFPVLPETDTTGFERTFREWLQTTVTTDAPGTVFNYDNAMVQAVSWICEAATGSDFAQLMSDVFWSRIGAETDAFVSVDREGGAMTCAGMVSTARDFARWGQMMVTGGAVDGEQVIPERAVHAVMSPSPKTRGLYARGTFAAEALPGDSYRSFWYSTSEIVEAVCARGRWGQNLIVVPGSDLVYAVMGSLPGTVGRHTAEQVLGPVAAIAAEVG